MDSFLSVLLDGLRPSRRTRVVDVGANPLEPPPYQPLLDARACDLIGFEPQKDAYDKLLAAKSEHETYIPHAVGEGGPVTLRIYRGSGFTSVYEPYEAGVRFVRLRGARVLKRVEVETVTLDSLPELAEIDLLKIDIQGGEPAVFRGGERTLANAMAVITELRFYPLYEGEPMLAGCDAELRRQGFQMHKILSTKARALASSQSGRLQGRRMRDQLIDGDAVYVRDMADPSSYSDEQLKHLCLTAAGCFGSHSLVLYTLDHLVTRGAVPADLPERYADALPSVLRADRDETAPIED